MSLEEQDEVENLAKKKDVVSYFKAINSRGLLHMKQGEFAEAIKAFNKIEEIDGDSIEISDEALQHAGNVYNNMGACYIRGNIGILKGIKSLSIAKTYYLAESEPPQKHLEEVESRLKEVEDRLKK